MSDAHKDKSADDNVEGGDSRNKDQDALGVSCQPDMVLTDEKLQKQEIDKCINLTPLVLSYSSLIKNLQCP